MKRTWQANNLMYRFVLGLCFFLTAGGAFAYTEQPGRTISANETWGPGTHFVKGTITVSDDIVLTVQPGSVVKFAPNTQLTVYGTLQAAGTGWETDNAIVFTSRDDNPHGEIVAGSDGIPAAGNWYGINLNGTGENDGIGEFDYCLFRYGGYSTSTYANVEFEYSDSGHMANCIVMTTLPRLLTATSFEEAGFEDPRPILISGACPVLISASR